MPNKTIEASGVDGNRIRIEFTWRSDRFVQAIRRIDADGQAFPLLESIEGTPAEPWPPSPPLQSLSIESLEGGRRAALLVGMAGGSHWSASVEPVSGEAALVLDVACRHSQQASFLGSRYRRVGENSDCVAVIAENATVVERPGEFEVQPATATLSAGTTRWKFRICLEPPQ